MSEPKPKKVQDIISAPVVSDDPGSQESLLARQAKTLQAQASADSVYDTHIERFSDVAFHASPRISPIVFLLCCMGMGLLLLLTTHSGFGKKRGSR